MNACMHDYAKEHGEVKVHDVGVEGNQRHLVRTMVSFVPVSRVLSSSQITTTLVNISVNRNAPSPIKSARKSSLSVVSRIDQIQDCSWFSHRTTSYKGQDGKGNLKVLNV